MLSDEQVAILREIDNSIAFDDAKYGKVTELIIDGYVEKDGDLYRLTAKGETALLGRGVGVTASE
jgi:predicted transcriptional regulator